MNKFFLFPLLLIFSCVSTPDNRGTSNEISGGKPAWIDNIDSVYDRSHFIAAVGHAANRETAEKNAIVNLASFFGQSIHSDLTIVNTYQEAIKNGIVEKWTDNINMLNTISTSVAMDSLYGVEVREVWHDTKNNVYYAAAVMERAITIDFYTNIITANLEIVNNLTSMSQTEKNTFEGFSRYQFAVTAADINIPYLNILRLLNASIPGGVKKGEEYRHEAQNIIRTIPIDIVVTNDKENRLKNAFAKVFSNLGFRSGGTNARYVLNVDVNISHIEHPNNPNKSILMELSANLIDTVTKDILLPFSFTSREGYTVVAVGENRMFLSAENRIEKEFKEVFSVYLSQLQPMR